MHENSLIWLETGKIGNRKSDNETQIIRSASNLSCHAYRDTQYEPNDMFFACSSSAPTLQKRDDSIGAPVSCPSPWRLWEPAAHTFRLWNGDLIKRGTKKTRMMPYRNTQLKSEDSCTVLCSDPSSRNCSNVIKLHKRNCYPVKSV